ncbi:MAG TPA: NnrS family protein [Burkholderiaceae bacterium]|nr:NnrS family protein [Burkholderiaceae bacterium]
MSTLAATASRSPSMSVFLSLGFRPLYIAGCLWALVSVAVWIFQPGLIPAPFDGISWHAHEMLWGFIATIAAGFLLTASGTWTGINPLRGNGLAAAAILWMIPRIAYLVGGQPAFLIGAAAETAFFAVCGLAIFRVVFKASNRRNYGLPLMMLGLGGFNILFLRAVMQGDYTQVIEQFNLGMLCMTLIVLLIGRRVIPFFAMRRTPGLDIPMQMRSGHIQLALTLLALVAGLAGQMEAMAIPLALTGAISLVQIVRWKPHAILHNPLLWILYLGYALCGIGLIMAAFQLAGISQGAFSRAAAHVHMIGMGGFSVLIIGMVTRTALGHLGRALALDASMLVSYYFMLAAVAFRLAALWPNSYYQSFLHAAALSWIISMGLYLWRFVPMLIRPRV